MEICRIWITFAPFFLHAAIYITHTWIAGTYLLPLLSVDRICQRASTLICSLKTYTYTIVISATPLKLNRPYIFALAEFLLQRSLTLFDEHLLIKKFLRRHRFMLRKWRIWNWSKVAFDRSLITVYFDRYYCFDRKLSTRSFFLVGTFGSLCASRQPPPRRWAGVRKKCGTCLLLTSPELSPGCSLVPQLQSVISPSPNLVPFSVSLLGYSYHRFLLPQETLSTIGTCKGINRGFVAGHNDTRQQIRAIKCNVQWMQGKTSRTCDRF